MATRRKLRTKKLVKQQDAEQETRQRAARLWLTKRAEAKESYRQADLALEALLGMGAKPGDCFRGVDGRMVVLVDHFATRIKNFTSVAFCRYSLEHVT